MTGHRWLQTTLMWIGMVGTILFGIALAILYGSNAPSNGIASDDVDEDE